MKKKIIIVAIIIILLVLLIPIPRRLKDGGTIEFKALTYKVAKVHKLNNNSENGYDNGIRIEILGKEIFNNVSIEKEENEEENKGKNYSTIIDDLKLELTIPKDWKYEELNVKKEDSYNFALQLSKSDSKRNTILYFFKENFTVCGTGRTEEEIILNNNDKAIIGYYGRDISWSDISFYDINPKIAIINNELSDNEAKEVLEFVKTLKIERLEDVILENFNKINEVSDSSSSNPYDYTKND